ncbi:MAG: cell division protein FtsH, partial [Betaproteobacteria bacterium]|nr:cell division protein FtsH [Betaproteobacteria bacterium]
LAYEEERAPFLGEVQVPGPRAYSEQTAREIDVAVREIVGAAHDKALAILTRDKPLLERGAALLLQKETLTEDELGELRRGAARNANGGSP